MRFKIGDAAEDVAMDDSGEHLMRGTVVDVDPAARQICLRVPGWGLWWTPETYARRIPKHTLRGVDEVVDFLLGAE